jgi:hypothetical protein
MPTNPATPSVMQAGMPSGLFFSAPNSFSPVAMISPAATAPMPRSAPLTAAWLAYWP